jgi:hypothetical protein
MIAGDISPIAALRNQDASGSVEYARDAAMAFELVLWLGTSSALPYIAAGGFWAPLKLGDVHLVRFAHRTNVFNRAMFEAVEVLPLSARGQVPTAAAWFPSPLPTDPKIPLTDAP